MKPVLMVALHYPPCALSSGIHRTLKFSRYLPALGWRPLVLTAHPRVHDTVSPEQMVEVPAEAHIVRAFALDTGRHLAIRGRYPRWLALPDRFVSWGVGAIPAGLWLVRRHRPGVLWSTFPVATAHLIGLTLHRLTGLPWVADFRDSMTEDHYPSDPVRWRLYRRIEAQTVRNAARLVFTARQTRDMYLARYPDLSPERCVVIPNGYDEADFRDIAARRTAHRAEQPFRLLHAGLIYPEERDPRAFFRALARLRKDGVVDPGRLSVELRASGSESLYGPMLRELDIEDLVHLLPPLPYRSTLEACLASDGLLLLQGASCNHQIPAKAYEYLRAGRPILALTADAGDTAALLRDAGGATIVDLADEDEIYEALPRFVNAVKAGRHAGPDPSRVDRFARHSQTADLGRLLSDVIHESSGRHRPGTAMTTAHGRT